MTEKCEEKVAQVDRGEPVAAAAGARGVRHLRERSLRGGGCGGTGRARVRRRCARAWRAPAAGQMIGLDRFGSSAGGFGREIQMKRKNNKITTAERRIIRNYVL